jgi:hypothetical protein
MPPGGARSVLNDAISIHWPTDKHLVNLLLTRLLR